MSGRPPPFPPTAAAACFIALKLPFRQIVNVIYGINGYVGILLIFFMLAKFFGLTDKVAAKK